jgi:D-glycero-alpha-D-manno-heptose-7-phosphate kinase
MAVIARAPLRISLAGGGTDLPAYAERFGGLVISTSINRYVYTILTTAPDDTLQITAADSNSVLSRRDHLFDSALFWGDDYRLPIEIAQHFNLRGGRRVFLAPEVPPGTGLGSSSATAVSMITALASDTCQSMQPRDIAELACEIEIERLGMPIGRQDQYASAFGGMNIIEFETGLTTVTPVCLPPATLEALEERILLFFTGQRRRSTDILNAQRSATEQTSSSTLEALHDIKACARAMIGLLERGELDHIGYLLDESWRRKRALAPGVSTPDIDRWYAEALGAGATGGKITGAGGGGFLMLYVDVRQRQQVIQRMSELGLVWVDMGFDYEGSSVLLNESDTPAFVTAD